VQAARAVADFRKVRREGFVDNRVKAISCSKLSGGDPH
jgi:hypothetical protein